MQKLETKHLEEPEAMEAHIYIYIYTYCNPWVQTWVVLEGCFPCWFGCSGIRIKSLLYRSFKPLLFFRQ